jgi:hypothetical protein
MTLGTCSFLLQNYYVQQWADNFVFHLFVSDLRQWWDHIVALDLGSRYDVKTRAPQLESSSNKGLSPCAAPHTAGENAVDRELVDRAVADRGGCGDSGRLALVRALD